MLHRKISNESTRSEKSAYGPDVSVRPGSFNRDRFRSLTHINSESFKMEKTVSTVSIGSKKAKNANSSQTRRMTMVSESGRQSMDFFNFRVRSQMTLFSPTVSEIEDNVEHPHMKETGLTWKSIVKKAKTKAKKKPKPEKRKGKAGKGWDFLLGVTTDDEGATEDESSAVDTEDAEAAKKWKSKLKAMKKTMKKKKKEKEVTSDEDEEDEEDIYKLPDTDALLKEAAERLDHETVEAEDEGGAEDVAEMGVYAARKRAKRKFKKKARYGPPVPGKPQVEVEEDEDVEEEEEVVEEEAEDEVEEAITTQKKKMKKRAKKLASRRLSMARRKKSLKPGAFEPEEFEPEVEESEYIVPELRKVRRKKHKSPTALESEEDQDEEEGEGEDMAEVLEKQRLRKEKKAPVPKKKKLPKRKKSVRGEVISEAESSTSIVTPGAKPKETKAKAKPKKKKFIVTETAESSGDESEERTARVHRPSLMGPTSTIPSLPPISSKTSSIAPFQQTTREKSLVSLSTASLSSLAETVNSMLSLATMMELEAEDDLDLSNFSRNDPCITTAISNFVNRKLSVAMEKKASEKQVMEKPLEEKKPARKPLAKKPIAEMPVEETTLEEKISEQQVEEIQTEITNVLENEEMTNQKAMAQIVKATRNTSLQDSPDLVALIAMISKTQDPTQIGNIIRDMCGQDKQDTRKMSVLADSLYRSRLVAKLRTLQLGQPVVSKTPELGGMTEEEIDEWVDDHRTIQIPEVDFPELPVTQEALYQARENVGRKRNFGLVSSLEKTVEKWTNEVGKKFLTWSQSVRELHRKTGKIADKLQEGRIPPEVRKIVTRFDFSKESLGPRITYKPRVPKFQGWDTVGERPRTMMTQLPTGAENAKYQYKRLEALRKRWRFYDYDEQLRDAMPLPGPTYTRIQRADETFRDELGSPQSEIEFREEFRWPQPEMELREELGLSLPGIEVHPRPRVFYLPKEGRPVEEDIQEYLISYKIPQLFQMLCASLLLSQPDNPLDFLIDQVRVMVHGAGIQRNVADQISREPLLKTQRRGIAVEDSSVDD